MWRPCLKSRPAGLRGRGYPVAMSPKLRHVVLFAFRDDAPDERIRAVVAAFAALRDAIPGIVDLEWGINDSPEGLAQGFTHCFLVTFEDAAARDVYLPHPAHVAFGTLLQPYLDSALVVDYVTRD
jgi:hypothetical protein